MADLVVPIPNSLNTSQAQQTASVLGAAGQRGAEILQQHRYAIEPAAYGRAIAVVRYMTQVMNELLAEMYGFEE